VTQLPKNDRHLNPRLPQDLYDQALAAATAEQRPLSSWVRRLVHRELADRLSAEMDAEETPHGWASNVASKARSQGAVPDKDGVFRSPNGAAIAGATKPLERQDVQPRLKKGGK
jgi:hypothetical protein